jgi:hypothetical protein
MAQDLAVRELFRHQQLMMEAGSLFQLQQARLEQRRLERAKSADSILVLNGVVLALCFLTLTVLDTKSSASTSTPSPPTLSPTSAPPDTTVAAAPSLPSYLRESYLMGVIAFCFFVLSSMAGAAAKLEPEDYDVIALRIDIPKWALVLFIGGMLCLISSLCLLTHSKLPAWNGGDWMNVFALVWLSSTGSLVLVGSVYYLVYRAVWDKRMRPLSSQ